VKNLISLEEKLSIKGIFKCYPDNLSSFKISYFNSFDSVEVTFAFGTCQCVSKDYSLKWKGGW
jgi:hypothetical protein